MNKYGLSEEEATRIATTDNILLSLDDLRYKYDNMRIGIDYPEWLTPEEHLKMCYATVWKRYNNTYFWFNSVDDVAHDLFVYSSVHLHKYSGKFQLNGLLLCRLKNLIRDYEKEKASFYENTYDWEDEVIDAEYNNKYKQAVKYNAVSINTNDTALLVMDIESIKNIKVKGILLICGYFLANIKEFLQPLVVYYNASTDTIKNKIYELGRDDKLFCKAIQRDVNMTNKVNVTVGRVLKIFGKRDKSYLRTELLPYLNTIGFTNINL